MNVGGTQSSDEIVKQIVEENSISASCSNFYSNYVDFVFQNWKNGVGQTVSSPITVSSHSTYDAVFIAKPSNSVENVSSPSQIGRVITITWTDNPNSNVTEYQIWRTVKHNGIQGNPELLATINSGVETYTDNEYIKTQSMEDVLQYDVRAKYTSSDSYIIGDYSDPDWMMIYGAEVRVASDNNKELIKLAMELPTEYSINNYPNPFNPTTKIKYQLPQDDFVTIRVYDVLGNEVANLVNKMRQAGYYEINFDGSSLSSGIYIYALQTNNFSLSKKMLLIK